MKRIFSLIICIFMIIGILFSGCGKRKEDRASFHDILDTIEQIPSNLTEDNTQESTADTAEPEPTASEAQPVETEPTATEPVESFPDDTQPAETDPATEPSTEPNSSEPIETQPVETTPDVEQQDEIQAFIDGISQKYGAVGIQVAIVDNGQIVGTYGSGWATRNVDPMTPDHKLRVASLSKIVIGMVAMQLRDSGVITMDTDIGPIWGVTARSSYYPDTPITIDYLLTHTSTISDYGNQADMDYETVKNRLNGGFTGAQPGSILNYYYNNYAFRLLGMTLELAAGQTLDGYLKSGLFATLGIDASFASGDLADPSKLATLYWEGNGVARSYDYQMNIHAPAFPGGDGFHYSGGLTISATDLAKILTVLVNDGQYNGQQILSAESVALMESYIDYRLYDGTYQARPMVYTPDIYGREGIYFHTGSGWGVYNCFSYDPITKDGVIVLTNGAASGGTNSCGIYWVCSEINDYVYNALQ